MEALSRWTFDYLEYLGRHSRKHPFFVSGKALPVPVRLRMGLSAFCWCWCWSDNVWWRICSPFQELEDWFGFRQGTWPRRYLADVDNFYVLCSPVGIPINFGCFTVFWYFWSKNIPGRLRKRAKGVSATMLGIPGAVGNIRGNRCGPWTSFQSCAANLQVKKWICLWTKVTKAIGIAWICKKNKSRTISLGRFSQKN